MSIRKQKRVGSREGQRLNVLDEQETALSLDHKRTDTCSRVLYVSKDPSET